MTDTDYRSIR